MYSNQLSSLILRDISKIEIPNGFCFLGVYPILMGFFKTNNPEELIQAIKTFSEKNFEDLFKTINYCISSSIYPHEDTIWMYNDSSAEISIFEHFFKNIKTKEDVELKIKALRQIIDQIKLHKSTLPFIEVNLFDDEKNLDYIEIQETSSLKSETAVYLEKSKKSKTCMIAPTLALGGLLYIGKTIGDN